ncbi:MAG: hypothetical protein EXQ86_03755 [Rhodospirillales bacterium]|nr:hypothetical protein [Rhodospirillales bacterium]
MPSSVRRVLALDSDTLLFRLAEGKLDVDYIGAGGQNRLLTLTTGEDGRPKPPQDFADVLKRLGTARPRIAVVVDAALALARKIRIPRLADADIASAIGLEIERLTPFRPEEVYIWQTIDGSDGDEKTQLVHVTFVPRRVLDPVLQGLRACGLAPSSVALAGEPGSAPRPLPVAGLFEAKPGGRLVPAMAALAVLLLGAAIVSPLFRLEAAVARLAEELPPAKRRAAATVALSSEIDRLTQGARIIAQSKAESASPLALINALSDLLPDGTWLSHFNVVGGEAVIEGWTLSSAELVGRLEGAGLFRSVSYLAPVTRDGERGFERFSFAAKLPGR